jgi:hypothetical protein
MSLSEPPARITVDIEDVSENGLNSQKGGRAPHGSRLTTLHRRLDSGSLTVAGGQRTFSAF